MSVFETVTSFDLFGAKITPTTREQLIALLKGHIDERRQCVIASQNMHGLHVRLWDASFERLHQLPQTYVHIDGMPLVLLCRLRGIAASRQHRVTLVDWIWPLLHFAASERRRMFYLGGKDEVLKAGRAAILRRIPNLSIRCHDGYFDTNDKAAALKVVKAINDFKPHIVLVGMGMGRQEHWILSNLEAIAPACVCTVGACMEYIAGAVNTPPRVLGQLGFEWFFRLAGQPQRFWYRYLLEPWFVLAYIIWYMSVPEIGRLSTEMDDVRRKAREALLDGRAMRTDSSLGFEANSRGPVRPVSSRVEEAASPIAPALEFASARVAYEPDTLEAAS